MCVRPQMIVGAANHLVCLENRTFGHQWLKRFLERNPEYHIRKEKHSYSVHDMSDYVEKHVQVIREKWITDLDIWNMNETGFRIGRGKAQLVVTTDLNKPLRMIDPENREKIDSEQVQQFICGSIASTQILELTARDLNAIQKATIARVNRDILGGQIAQKGGTMKVSECRTICSKRKGKKEEEARKRKEREDKQAEKQVNSQLAQIEVLSEGVSPVE